jgi:hypothetical protein
MQGSRICQISSEGAVLDACYTIAGDKVATCSSTGAIQVLGYQPFADRLVSNRGYKDNG